MTARSGGRTTGVHKSRSSVHSPALLPLGNSAARPYENTHAHARRTHTRTREILFEKTDVINVAGALSRARMCHAGLRHSPRRFSAASLPKNRFSRAAPFYAAPDPMCSRVLHACLSAGQPPPGIPARHFRSLSARPLTPSRKPNASLSSIPRRRAPAHRLHPFPLIRHHCAAALYLSREF